VSSSPLHTTFKTLRWTHSTWLVVEPPLWNIWKSVGVIIPNTWKNKTCSKPTTSYDLDLLKGRKKITHIPNIRLDVPKTTRITSGKTHSIQICWSDLPNWASQVGKESETDSSNISCWLNRLVVGIPIWKMMEWVTVEMMIPNVWKNNPKVPNHQPAWVRMSLQHVPRHVYTQIFSRIGLWEKPPGTPRMSNASRNNGVLYIFPYTIQSWDNGVSC